MSGRFVRASKYRHIFGRPTRKEQCYDNLRISNNAWDTNLVKANPQYISVNWQASGGGAFAVIPINEKGRLPEQLPLFRGHTAPVLDTDWSPFNDSFIASGSDDAKVFLWKVPEGFTLYTDAEEPQSVSPVAKLVGHSRKVGHVLFNPAAENILATSSGDYTIKLWDVEAQSPRLTLKHGDIVQSLSWSANGSLLVTTSRDKKLRIWDVRQEKPAHEVPGHSGAKNSRAVWMGEHDRVATTGFSKMSDRQLGLWDIRAPKEPLGGFQVLDSISGVCMPFWDEGTQCLYLAGKGDGNIRYFEYENDKFEFLSEYKSGEPQRGVAFLPKRGVNTHDNEVMRAFKTVNDSYIEPISFIVPRRAEVFQSDIYPPTTGIKPAMSAAEWFDEKEALPPKIDLESVYDGEEPTEVPATSKPAATQARPSSPKIPSPTKKETEPPKEVTSSAVESRGPPPSMKAQQGSIAALASKFADDDDASEDEDDDSSSFEEVSKPTDRSERTAPVIASQAGKTAPSTLTKVAEADQPTTKTNTSQAAVQFTPFNPPQTTQNDIPPTQSKSLQQPSGPAPEAQSKALPSSQPSIPSGSAEPIHSYFNDIKRLLEQQTETMAAQSEKIGLLTAEVDTLKTKIGESTLSSGRGRDRENEKDERIRELELQLGVART